jgi:Protein of unknown function (DUF3501)
MRPLCLDDLLPLEEYAPRRREFFHSLERYLDLYRRVRIGPSVTLLFENRQTLWFRVQEILRIARLSDAKRVQEELDVYNQLLPGPTQLQAAVVLQPGEARPGSTLPIWNDLHGEHIKLYMGSDCFPSTLVTVRPEDQAIGFSHWLQFSLGPLGQKHLADLHRPVYLEMSHPQYQHESLQISADIRQSLLDDLSLSERDGK